MELRFWGVRGSYPTPGLGTVMVGGNTTCVSVEYGSSIFVFDAGTGICRLGDYLERSGRQYWHGCIFLSHYHWDHIQGLPFFGPAFKKHNSFHLYGEGKQGQRLEDILRQQMQAPYFPVPMDIQKGLAAFTPIVPGTTLDLKAEISVRTLALIHPGGSVGYRIESPGGSVCIITDHEHPADGLDERVVDFARGASVLVHEAPYTPEEKRGPRAGWGHSTWHEAALVARRAGVGRLYLSHHEPSRSDKQLFSIVEQARDVFANAELAIEGTYVDLRDPPFDFDAAQRAWEATYEHIDARAADRSVSGRSGPP
jgi:phosphoribosyl 1,2-cyclic phosphodiesterase